MYYGACGRVQYGFTGRAVDVEYFDKLDEIDAIDDGGWVLGMIQWEMDKYEWIYFL